ncbi:MAG: PAS domain-containing protein [Candidatus Omnitrophica bacterium]|nr:PAS domain-containing protein [Candidatus Omnitrophota bacterium]
MTKKRKQNKDMKQSGWEGLLSKEKLLSYFMAHIPDVIYFKDTKGRLVLVNEAHARGLGLKPEQVKGKTDFDFFPKERAQLMKRDDEQVMKSRKPLIDKIERATRPDGIDNYSSTTKIPILDDKKKVIGLMGITRDITRRIQIERLKQENAYIEKRLEALEELNKMKSEFVSVVSHEIRTPLAIIKDAVSLMYDKITGPITPQQKEMLNKTRANIEHLRYIIEELLDVSRIESGRLRLRYSLASLNRLLEDSADFFRRMAAEKNISLEYKLPRKEINLFMDTERIKQVISNLINNAIKYSDEGDRITVEMAVFGTKVRIGILDTGTGIPKADLPHLFNKFVQGSLVSAKAERKGVGLGLSISRELVERHKGEIWVESKLGAGSRFYFTLPRFCATEIGGWRLKEKINKLLERNVPVYLINVVFVDYGGFKKKTRLNLKKLFLDLEHIASATFNRSWKSGEERTKILLADGLSGEYSIIFTDPKENEAMKICEAFRVNLEGYFKKNRVDRVFINLGSPQAARKLTLDANTEALVNLNIKKIFIGAEIRNFRRVDYQADIELNLAGAKPEACRTVDISRGGACILANLKFPTDAKLNARLWLAKNRDPLILRARVAWIKDLSLSAKSDKYKIGLQFTDLADKDKKALARFMKSLSSHD